MKKLLLEIRLELIALGMIALLAGALTVYARSATLYFSPNSGTIGVTSFNVSVIVSSDQENINSVTATIKYPADKLEVVGVSSAGSIIDTWISGPTYSNSDGSVSFEGLILGSPFQGEAGTVLTITFKAKTQGVAVVWFDEAAILASDSEGTNVLSGAGAATFSLNGSGVDTVPVTPTPEPAPLPPPPPVTPPVVPPTPPEVTTPPPVTPTPEPAPANAPAPPAEPPSHPSADQDVPGSLKYAPEAPVVSSSTHPDPEKWYANSNPMFSWSIANGITGVNFYGDHNPGTYLGENSDGLRDSYTYSDVEDGVWYFHIRLRNRNGWGNITHRKFQIDTVKPSDLQIHRVSTGAEAQNDIGAEVSLLISATDALSGIAGFDVAVDDEKPVRLAVADKNYFTTPVIKYGSHILDVTAYDKAGNSISKQISFEVTAPIDINAGLDAGLKGSAPDAYADAESMQSTVLLFLQTLIPTMIILLLLNMILLKKNHREKPKKLQRLF